MKTISKLSKPDLDSEKRSDLYIEFVENTKEYIEVNKLFTRLSLMPKKGDLGLQK